LLQSGSQFTLNFDITMARIFLTFTLLLAVQFINAQQQYRRPATFRQTSQEEPLIAEQPLVHRQEEPLRPKVYEVRHEISPNLGDGHYKFFSEFSDGLRQEQEGFVNRPNPSSVKEGSYTTYDENGQVIEINYIADKDGFRPANYHHNLPTSPPLPEDHVKAREEILRQQKLIRQEHLGQLRAGYAGRL